MWITEFVRHNSRLFCAFCYGDDKGLEEVGVLAFGEADFGFWGDSHSSTFELTKVKYSRFMQENVRFLQWGLKMGEGLVKWK